MTGGSRRAFLVQAATASLFPLLSGKAQGASGARRTVRADPGNYRSKLQDLRPGDMMVLAAGKYTRGLPLHGLVGTVAQPFVIEGPKPPARAVFIGRPGAHTVSLLESAHVVLRNVVLDGRGVPVDAVRAEGHGSWTHHITLEGLTIVNHAASQQNSGISTKCPSWGWVVRGNTIRRVGTGMYFGDSDGSDSFFDSLIEGNRIFDTVGYGIQIKHQHARPAGLDLPAAPRSTVIRRNVIVKGRVAVSPELARPSLLVGHWPLSGAGSNDRYLIYQNLLFDNPSESLFQGEGNIALYNNLLVNPRGEGVRIQPHNDKPREVAVFNNTIVAAALGVEFVGGEPGYGRLFTHNLVYGNPPLHSEVDGENLTGAYDRAREAFVALNPTDPSRLDHTPRAGAPSPQFGLGADWLALPSAQQDHIGRPRPGASFGACLPGDAAAGAACR